jgi:hypothetical protein
MGRIPEVEMGVRVGLAGIRPDRKWGLSLGILSRALVGKHGDLEVLVEHVRQMSSVRAGTSHSQSQPCLWHFPISRKAQCMLIAKEETVAWVRVLHLRRARTSAHDCAPWYIVDIQKGII